MLNVLEAFEFKGLDTFLKEEKRDFTDTYSNICFIWEIEGAAAPPGV